MRLQKRNKKDWSLGEDRKNSSQKHLKVVPDSIRKIEKQIRSIYLEYEGSLATATQLAVKLGTKFVNLNDLITKKGKPWEKYLRRRFPYIHIRKIQRYMRVSKCVDLKKFSSLGYLPICKLETIAKWFEDRPVGPILIKHGVDPSLVKPNVKAIEHFKMQVDEVIKEFQSGGGWIDEDNPGPHNENRPTEEDARIRRKIAKRNKENKRMAGIVFSAEIERSIKSTTTTLIKNFRILLMQDSVLRTTTIEGYDDMRLERGSLQKLRKLLSKIMKTERFFDSDVPEYLNDNEE